MGPWKAFGVSEEIRSFGKRLLSASHETGIMLDPKWTEKQCLWIDLGEV